MDDRTSDAELVAMARSGDREAFGALVERHQPMARRVAFRAVGHEDIAAELANEAMLQAYLSLDRLRDASLFQSWLHGIVLNVCRGHIRERQRAPLSYEEVMGGVRNEGMPFTVIEPAPHEVVESQELHRVVLHAVESLPPKARVATLLFYYDQLSVREVAATLGMSVSAVKNRLHDARTSLREALLPLYSGPGRVTTREKKEEESVMIEVKIADVVEQKREDEDTGDSWPVHVVLLVDEQGRRMLPIWLGVAEGRAIAVGLKEVELPRPLTFTFVANLLEATDVQVEEVSIESLKKDTLYAVVKLRNGESVVEVDARPSDAMALALYTGKPIYANKELLDQSGVDIPAWVKDIRAKTDGVGSILERYHRATTPLRSEEAEAEEPHDAETQRETRQKHHQELIASLFGEEPQ